MIVKMRIRLLLAIKEPPEKKIESAGRGLWQGEFELADKLASSHLQGCDSVDALQSKIMAAASNLRSSTKSAGYASA